MQSKMRTALAIVATQLLSACISEPDLSGKISFKWTWPDKSPLEVKNYAVVSDAAGKVIEWRELPNGQLVEMSYPPDGQTANVSIIVNHIVSPNTSFAQIYTFANIPGGDYSFTETAKPNLTPDGYHDVKIDRSTYDEWSVVSTGHMDYLLEDYQENYFLKPIGLFNDRNDNLFVSVKKKDENEWRYLLSKGITIGSNTIIDPETYSSLVPMNSFDVDFPARKDMNQTRGAIMGKPVNSDEFYTMSAGNWSTDETPSLAFVDIPEMFSDYRTFFYSDTDYESITIDITSDEPVTEFPSLDIDVQIKENNTKRIAFDVSGDGDVLDIFGQWRVADATNDYSTQWFISAPSTPEFSLRLPQFPGDLYAQIPGLSTLADQKFRSIEVVTNNMSYNEFTMFRLKGQFLTRLPYYASKGFRALDKL